LRIPNVIDALAGERRPGLLFVDSFGHRRDYTFAEIADQSRRYAAALQSLPVGDGESVLVCTSNTGKTLFIMLALARLGKRAVACTEELEGQPLLERAKQSNAVVVIANRKRRTAVEELKAQLPAQTRYVLIGEERDGWARLDTFAASAKPYPGNPELSPDDDAAAAAAISTLGAQSEDRVWCTMPIGSEPWWTYVRAPWSSGAATIVHEGKFDPRERLDLARELEVTVLLQPPHEFAAQVDLADVDRFRLPYLRRCISTAPLETEIERRWTERFGVPLTHAGTTTSATS
jgi:acyl-coenzyme A synthetase/AMP-(fatty) acid ligase